MIMISANVPPNEGYLGFIFQGSDHHFCDGFCCLSLVFSALGVRYSIALAALTGLAIFIPYVGLWTTSIVMVLVTFFQPSNYFGLTSLAVFVMVLAIVLIINFYF